MGCNYLSLPLIFAGTSNYTPHLMWDYMSLPLIPASGTTLPLWAEHIAACIKQLYDILQTTFSNTFCGVIFLITDDNFEYIFLWNNVILFWSVFNVHISLYRIVLCLLSITNRPHCYALRMWRLWQITTVTTWKDKDYFAIQDILRKGI